MFVYLFGIAPVGQDTRMRFSGYQMFHPPLFVSRESNERKLATLHPRSIVASTARKRHPARSTPHNKYVPDMESTLFGFASTLAERRQRREEQARRRRQEADRGEREKRRRGVHGGREGGGGGRLYVPTPTGRPKDRENRSVSDQPSGEPPDLVLSNRDR